VIFGAIATKLFLHGVFELRNMFETIFSRLINADYMIASPNRFQWSQIISEISISDDTFRL